MRKEGLYLIIFSSVEDSERALVLLKRLRGKLSDGSEKSIRNAMDRLIGALESDLFVSLLGISFHLIDLQ